MIVRLLIDAKFVGNWSLPRTWWLYTDCWSSWCSTRLCYRWLGRLCGPICSRRGRCAASCYQLFCPSCRVLHRSCCWLRDRVGASVAVRNNLLTSSSYNLVYGNLLSVPAELTAICVLFSFVCSLLRVQSNALSTVPLSRQLQIG